MINYGKKKRAKNDFCNICEKKQDLTWDHVPPKSCKNEGRMIVNNMFYGTDENDRKEIVQNGIKFRTICANCNNALLGDYDKDLKIFSEFVYSCITGSLKMPTQITFKCKPNKIARSIVGHFLAAQTDFLVNSPLENKLRKYFLDTQKKDIEDCFLLFYINIYNHINIMRDFCIVDVIENKTPESVFSIMKFPPLSFLLSEHKNVGNIQNFSSFCSSNLNEEVDILINFRNCFDNKGIKYGPYWPYNDNSLMLFAEGSLENSKETWINNVKK